MKNNIKTYFTIKGRVQIMTNLNNYKFAIIKIKKGTSIGNNLNSYINSCNGFEYYFNNLNDRELKRALILECSDRIDKLFWCKCTFREKKEKEFLVCKPLYESSSEIVINNTISSILLDISADFEQDFITVEYSKNLFEQFEKLNTNNYSFGHIDREYASKETESGLSLLAQKNEYCRRQYNLKEPTGDERGEYQRDYDRIIYSKAYRRMVDKTQVFSASKGDHYRTRMTHTMIVCQIARSICNALRLNQSLTEAIALGHDLGHTPFGHAGERQLNKMLEVYPFVGGFKHNYQGVRVVSKLEKEYYEIDGLDLSYQVMEGMFKHTKQKKGLSMNEFTNDLSFIEYLHLELEHSVTLEGQIVAIADEIAQRSHDMDDAFAANLLSIDDFMSYLFLRKFEALGNEINKIKERRSSDMPLTANDDELFATQISSAIVKYFIEDVTKKSRGLMAEYLETNGDVFQQEHIVKEKLIRFSDTGEKICIYLEKILSNKVLNSNEVSTADENAKIIIKSLFDAYYNNPRLLHFGTKNKLYIDFINEKNTSRKIKSIIDLTEGNAESIKTEFKRIIETSGNYNDKDEYFIKKKILIRTICDYISGMTDSYAIEEYKKICKSV